MKSEKIQDGYRIEGITFVVNTAQSYDCYIVDIGSDSIMEAAQNVDLMLLIAGKNTKKAVRKEDTALTVESQEDDSAIKDSPESMFFQLSGGLKLSKLPRIDKITRDYILRRREKGVCQFVTSYKFLGKFRLEKIPWE